MAAPTTLLPPAGVKNKPEANRDSAAPTAATMVESDCKTWESRVRAVVIICYRTCECDADNRGCRWRACLQTSTAPVPPRRRAGPHSHRCRGLRRD